MFRYPAAYRFYTLAKAGFCLAYLWYVGDFFRIHLNLWHQPIPLLPLASRVAFSGNAVLDVPLRALAVFVSSPPMVWTFLVAALFLWGRYRPLQAVVETWMSLSMIALASLAGAFVSSADIGPGTLPQATERAFNERSSGLGRRPVVRRLGFEFRPGSPVTLPPRP